LQKDIAEEHADRLRLLIVVGGHGAFVTAFRKGAEIVHADLNRQPPNSAPLPFPVGSHSLSRCCHRGPPSMASMVTETVGKI
jgi:hypothetical protein